MNKFLIAAIALFAIAGAAAQAQAGSRCYKMGNQWVCNYDDGSSTRCYWMGNTYVCN